MDTVKVSVIIPVYNTVRYVEAALESILHQTLQEIEVIVIDDGSTDGSGELLRRLSSLDSRIHLMSQINSGQAIARNAGIDLAKGEFLYFMDSDDLLVSTALEECYLACCSDDLDFVFFDAETFSEEDIPVERYMYKRCSRLIKGVYSGVEIMNTLMDNDAFRVAPWLQLIRKSYIDRIALRYVPVTHEDELFTHLLFMYADRVSFIDQAFFYRRLRSNSVVTSTFRMKNAEAYLYIVDVLLLKKLLSSTTAVQSQVIDRSVKRIMDGMLYRARELSYRDRLKICKRVFKHRLNFVEFKRVVALLLKFK